MKPTGSEITTLLAGTDTAIGMQLGERGSATPTSLREAVAETAGKAQGIVNFASSLKPQEATRFRAWLAVRAEATLADYWDRSPPDAVKAEQIKDWISVLSPFSPAEILLACRAWKVDNPSHRPGPGHIAGIINAERGRWVSARPKQTPEPPRVVTPEEMEHRRKVAAEILGTFRGENRAD